jgi:transposase
MEGRDREARMEVFIGVDAAKDVHWACAVDRDAQALFNRAVANDPDGIAGLVADIAALEAARVTVALDLLGGSATLVCAMLADAGLAVLHTPGLAVNRARQGMRGGENKSDPRDAATIAELARTRRDLRPVEVGTEIDVDIRLLVGRRREIVVDQTRRLSRLRDLLSSLFPALERRIDVTTRAGLVFLGLFAAPHEMRRANPARMARQLARAARNLRGVEGLARDAIGLARAQTIDVPGAETRARLVKDLAAEALRARETRIQIDADLEALLARHPDAALIQSLPGMGVVLTAEFVACAGNRARFQSADALAAAAGLTPVLRQSGKSRAIRRSTSGDRALKRVFFQSAFVALSHPESRAFYDRKRAEGERHNQAVIALARPRVNVLWAFLNTRQPYRENIKLAA